MNRIDTLLLHKAGAELSALGEVSFNASLSLYTTFRTGGDADLIIIPRSSDSLSGVLSVLFSAGIPCHVLGGCSNILVSDEGVRGAVVLIRDSMQPALYEEELIYAEAGMDKKRFILETIAAGFSGMEFMAGIPGNIGGGIFMNAGTYMGCFADILEAIKISDRSGHISTFPVVRSVSGYRTMDIPAGAAVLGGYFRLPRTGNPDETAKRIDVILADRRSKHPLEYPSAGSVFKNPGSHSSWKLINDSGLRGFRIGGAVVSEKHTNFIINAGGATSSEIYSLIMHVRDTVYSETGIKLESEIKFIGRF